MPKPFLFQPDEDALLASAARTRAIAAELKALRQKRKVAQQAIADVLGLDQSMVSRYESGQIAWTLTQFLAVCALLKVNPCTLIKATEDAWKA